MVITLANGRNIEISVKQYLDMTDDEFIDEMNDLSSKGFGQVMEDPFFRSAIRGKINEEDIEEYEPSVDELSSIEKLIELDLDLPMLDT